VGEPNAQLSLPKNIFIVSIFFIFGRKMAKREVNTREGEHVAVFVKNVAVVFQRVKTEEDSD